MAISTLDGVIAGLRVPEQFLKVTGTMEAAGVMHSLLYTSGMPGAGATPAPGINGAALTTYAGQMPYTNPSSGNGYLARLSCRAGIAGTLIVADRLWHNSGVVVTTTGAQPFSSVAWPARDSGGSTNGEGVLVGIEVSGATTNAGAVTNTTLSYVNSTNTGGTRTATIASFPATSVAGTFVPFQLQAGDTGIRSASSITLGTSYGGGAIHLVAYRVLAQIGVPVAGAGFELDALSLGLPRLYDNTVPFLLWLPSATTTHTVAGEVTYAHG